MRTGLDVNKWACRISMSNNTLTWFWCTWHDGSFLGCMLLRAGSCPAQVPDKHNVAGSRLARVSGPESSAANFCNARGHSSNWLLISISTSTSPRELDRRFSSTDFEAGISLYSATTAGNTLHIYDIIPRGRRNWGTFRQTALGGWQISIEHKPWSHAQSTLCKRQMIQ